MQSLLHPDIITVRMVKKINRKRFSHKMVTKYTLRISKFRKYKMYYSYTITSPYVFRLLLANIDILMNNK